MTEGHVPWPDDFVTRYRRAGLWERVTVAEMVARTAARAPNKTAVVDGDRRTSYADIVRISKRHAYGLARLGFSRGSRVVLQLPNVLDFVTTYLALNWIGVIPVMALRAHRQTEVRHFIQASDAVGYIGPDVVGRFDYRAMAQELTAQFPTLRHVVIAGDAGEGHVALRDIDDQTIPDADVDAEIRSRLPDPSDVSTMLLSGGTTSLSKLIPRTHDDYVLNARLCSEVAGFTENTVFMAVLPLGHNYNLASPGLLGAFYRGGTVVLAASPTAEDVFPLVEREGVTAIAAAVPLITNWLTSEASRRCDLSSLSVIENGGARLPPELRTRIRAQFGAIPQEIYGTAEGLINMTRLDDPDHLLLSSSGAPVCDLDEIRVVDNNGHDVPEGEPGELVTRGPYTIRGYFNAPGQNADAFLADGWYRMGDIVRREGRYVYTEGRRKDLINRGGEKISCEEIESLIVAHPKVKAVAIVAMPDPVFGEKACACVVTETGQSLAFEELIAFLREQHIAAFKLPERLEVLAELPVSPVGKILKRELRERIAARLEAEAGRRQ